MICPRCFKPIIIKGGYAFAEDFLYCEECEKVVESEKKKEGRGERREKWEVGGE